MSSAWVVASCVALLPACSEQSAAGGAPAGSAGRSGVGGSGGYAGVPGHAGASGHGGEDAGRPPFRPDLPVNQWLKQSGELPANTWESTLTYDPTKGRLALFGGHVLGAYVQNDDLLHYDPREGSFHYATPPESPPRQCLVSGVFATSVKQLVMGNGGSLHGAMQQGGFTSDYTAITTKDPRGPWLYDSTLDRWEEARPLGGPAWDRIAHAQMAYDEATDAVIYIAGTKTGVYSPWTNTLRYRSLPEELHARRGYAIAADPVSDRIVVFGGSGPGTWTNKHEDRSIAYDQFVHRDTWTYHPLSDTWTKLETHGAPPRGSPMTDFLKLPMVYHPPSGRMLLHTNPLNHYQPAQDWERSELWSFDPSSASWALEPTSGAPRYSRLLAYAEGEDLLVAFGGGDDHTSATNPRPALSRELWWLRPRLTGDLRPRVAPPRPSLLSDATGVVLTWPTTPGAEEQVFRAEVSPFPSDYQLLGRATGGRFEDRNLSAEKSYMYRVSRADGRGHSPPVFSSPARVKGLRAWVVSASEVRLAWDAAQAPDVVGYHVYRARGGDASAGRGARLTTAPVATPQWVDDAAELTDGVARGYWVRAVNALGVESGASAVTYTFPAAPRFAHAEPGPEPETIRVAWDWPAEQVGYRFMVYHVDYNVNTYQVSDQETSAWYAAWKAVTPSPISAREFSFSTLGASAQHHYFYIRAVNPLEQLGYYTDIVSATDARFTAHLP